MTTAVTYTLVYDRDGHPAGYTAHREGQYSQVGYAVDQLEALEALLRAEHREATT